MALYYDRYPDFIHHVLRGLYPHGARALQLGKIPNVEARNPSIYLQSLDVRGVALSSLGDLRRGKADGLRPGKNRD